MSSHILPGWISPPDFSNQPASKRKGGNSESIQQFTRSWAAPKAAKAAKTAAKIGRPRPRPEKPKREGWYSGLPKPGVTLERILELRAEGLPARAIAEKLDGSSTKVDEHIRQYRKSSDEADAMEINARICPRCSNSKTARMKACARCLQNERKRNARGAATQQRRKLKVAR